MALQSSGTITMAQIQTEFGGSNPASLNEYYRGGSYVPDTSTNSGIPTSGTIDMADFYGGANFSPDLVSTVNCGVSSASNKQGFYTIRGFETAGGPLGSLPDSSLLFTSGKAITVYDDCKAKVTSSGTNQDRFWISYKTSSSNFTNDAAFLSHMNGRSVTASFSSSSGAITLNTSNGSFTSSTSGSDYIVDFVSTQGSSASQTIAAVFGAASAGNVVTLTHSA